MNYAPMKLKDGKTMPLKKLDLGTGGNILVGKNGQKPFRFMVT